MKKKSNNRKNNLTFPFDEKIEEKCPDCSAKIFYRKKPFHNYKIYYKICNDCGWYFQMDKTAWKEIVKKAEEEV